MTHEELLETPIWQFTKHLPSPFFPSIAAWIKSDAMPKYGNILHPGASQSGNPKYVIPVPENKSCFLNHLVFCVVFWSGRPM
jgi:hypothetical protein